MPHVKPAAAIKPGLSCRRHRFPRQIIALAVWFYYRFALSLRMVEEMLAGESHQPMRMREKVMRRFKSLRQLPHFTAVHDPLANLFMHCRYHTDAEKLNEQLGPELSRLGLRQAPRNHSLALFDMPGNIFRHAEARHDFELRAAS